MEHVREITNAAADGLPKPNVNIFLQNMYKVKEAFVATSPPKKYNIGKSRCCYIRNKKPHLAKHAILNFCSLQQQKMLKKITICREAKKGEEDARASRLKRETRARRNDRVTN